MSFIFLSNSQIIFLAVLQQYPFELSYEENKIGVNYAKLKHPNQPLHKLNGAYV